MIAQKMKMLKDDRKAVANEVRWTRIKQAKNKAK
jgi:hypothetical protein